MRVIANHVVYLNHMAVYSGMKHSLRIGGGERGGHHKASVAAISVRGYGFSQEISKSGNWPWGNGKSVVWGPTYIRPAGEGGIYARSQQRVTRILY